VKVEVNNIEDEPLEGGKCSGFKE